MDNPIADVQDQASRNEFIDNYLRIKDYQFQNYKTAFRRGSSYGELSADGARIVLDSLAALTGTAATKSGLAAASAGVTGFTGSVKKEILYDQSVRIYIDKMEGLRAAKKADILSKKTLSYSRYTGSEAFSDIEEYARLGTFDAALRSVSQETSQATADAQQGEAQVKGDTHLEQALSRAPYQGQITSTTYAVEEKPVKRAPDLAALANSTRRDLNKLDAKGAVATIAMAQQYAILKSAMNADPQGDRDSRSYIGHMIDVAWKGHNADQLKAWRAIIPVNPAPPPSTPPPLPEH